MHTIEQSIVKHDNTTKPSLYKAIDVYTHVLPTNMLTVPPQSLQEINIWYVKSTCNN